MRHSLEICRRRRSKKKQRKGTDHYHLQSKSAGCLQRGGAADPDKDGGQNNRKSDCPVLLVTSAVPGEGKTTVAVNLAEAFAKKKYRVVLLDGDLRNPSVMKCMGLIGRKERGIAAVLKGQMDWEEALTDCRDLTLKILPGAGSTQNPAGLLRSVRMKTMIESLKEEADLLIIDTPPCGVLSDAALFGGIADGAVLVVHQGTTKDREVRRALEFSRIRRFRSAAMC